MLGFWDFLTVALVLVALFGKKFWAMFWFAYWYRQIIQSSHRIGLRDKGESEGDWVHDVCDTSVRIGIDPQGKAHEYCWRCECLAGEEDDPDGGETLQIKSENSIDKEAHKVLDFSELKLRKKAA